MFSKQDEGRRVGFGRAAGEQTLGQIVKVNPKTIAVRQLESRGSLRDYPIGTMWRVDPKFVRFAEGAQPVAVKRPDSEILREIRACYSALSPENLSCDGELPWAMVAKRRRDLEARLSTLQRELGRPASEGAAYSAV